MEQNLDSNLNNEIKNIIGDLKPSEFMENHNSPIHKNFPSNIGLNHETGNFESLAQNASSQFEKKHMNKYFSNQQISTHSN